MSPPTNERVVVLFYRYFLPTPPSPQPGSSLDDASAASPTSNGGAGGGAGGGARAVDEATLRFFRSRASQYVPLLERRQRDLCRKLDGDDDGGGGVKGRVLLSREGINGTLSCSREMLARYVEEMEGFDLIGDLGVPPREGDGNGAMPSGEEEVPEPGKGRLFANVDWKTSAVSDGEEPFPDLKIQVVKEIVNTGGSIEARDIPRDSGKEISPEEFHDVLVDAQKRGRGEGGSEGKEVVLIDVRNTFEHAIGHFLHPRPNAMPLDGSSEAVEGARRPSGGADNGNSESSADEPPTPALNPNTVTFSHFDSTFCSPNADALKDKKVLMYCTGGIRCVKASAMLKKRGVEDVCHLSGGIHRYVERYGSKGFWKGKVAVFDRRVALDPDEMAASPGIERTGGAERGGSDEPNGTDERTLERPGSSSDVVGRCVECRVPHDRLSGATLCTVCRDLILLCPKCRESLREFHCDRHRPWKDLYFTFLEPFDADELRDQTAGLRRLHDEVHVPAKEHKNVRRTLRKQIEKLEGRMRDLEEGRAATDRNARRRCRTCFETEDVCDGLCWGFWRSRPRNLTNDGGGDNELEPIRKVELQDRVIPGPNWNEARHGIRRRRPATARSRKSSRRGDGDDDDRRPDAASENREGDERVGTVVEVKSWASGGGDGEERDCVVVEWDADPPPRRDRRGKKRKQKDDDASIRRTGVYRWGTVARNGKRIYDVKLFPA